MTNQTNQANAGVRDDYLTLVSEADAEREEAFDATYNSGVGQADDASAPAPADTPAPFPAPVTIDIHDGEGAPADASADGGQPAMDKKAAAKARRAQLNKEKKDFDKQLNERVLAEFLRLNPKLNSLYEIDDKTEVRIKGRYAEFVNGAWGFVSSEDILFRMIDLIESMGINKQNQLISFGKEILLLLNNELRARHHWKFLADFDKDITTIPIRGGKAILKEGKGGMFEIIDNHEKYMNVSGYDITEQEINDLLPSCRDGTNEWCKIQADWIPCPKERRALNMATGCGLLWNEPKKILFLEGKTNNGKSEFIKARQRAYSTDHWFSPKKDIFFSVNGSEPSPFSAIDVKDKMWVYASEGKKKGMLRTEIVKEFTSGDMIYGEQKGVKGGNFEPRCVIIISLNTMCKCDEIDEAIKTRMMIFPFRVDQRFGARLSPSEYAKAIAGVSKAIFVCDLLGMSDWIATCRDHKEVNDHMLYVETLSNRITDYWRSQDEVGFLVRSVAKRSEKRGQFIPKDILLARIKHVFPSEYHLLDFTKKAKDLFNESDTTRGMWKRCGTDKKTGLDGWEMLRNSDFPAEFDSLLDTPQPPVPPPPTASDADDASRDDNDDANPANFQ